MLAKVGKAPRLRSPKPNCKNLLSPQDKLALIQLSETCHSEHAEKKINVKGGSAEGLWNFNSMFNSFFLNSFAAATQLAQFWVQARSTPQSERNTAGREQGRGGWRSTFFLFCTQGCGPNAHYKNHMPLAEAIFRWQNMVQSEGGDCVVFSTEKPSTRQ